MHIVTKSTIIVQTINGLAGESNLIIGLFAFTELNTEQKYEKKS